MGVRGAEGKGACLGKRGCEEGLKKGERGGGGVELCEREGRGKSWKFKDTSASGTCIPKCNT